MHMNPLTAGRWHKSNRRRQANQVLTITRESASLDDAIITRYDNDKAESKQLPSEVPILGRNGDEVVNVTGCFS